MKAGAKRNAMTSETVSRFAISHIVCISRKRKQWSEPTGPCFLKLVHPSNWVDVAWGGLAKHRNTHNVLLL